MIDQVSLSMRIASHQKEDQAGMPALDFLVLPLSVVDNSVFSPNHLTAWETLLILASQGAHHAPHFK
jgi:hypothetical protein